MEVTLMKEFQKKLNMSTWDRNFLRDKELFGDSEVYIEDFIDDMQPNEKQTMMLHIGEDNLGDVCNFVPTIVVKVTQHLQSNG